MYAIFGRKSHNASPHNLKDHESFWALEICLCNHMKERAILDGECRRGTQHRGRANHLFLYESFLEFIRWYEREGMMGKMMVDLQEKLSM